MKQTAYELLALLDRNLRESASAQHSVRIRHNH